MELVVLLGAPGSGKGTVAACLARRRPGLDLVVAGDLLRDAVRRGTPAGRDAEACMRQGGLVPDAVIARLIDERLASPGGGVRVLDGFPRTLEQAARLDAMARAHGAVLAAVVLLEVPEGVILERLGGRRVCPSCARIYHLRTMPPARAGACDACGTTLALREDDRPETVRNRLAVYADCTAELIGLYAQRGVLKRVDGVGSVDEVADRVDRALA